MWRGKREGCCYVGLMGYDPPRKVSFCMHGGQGDNFTKRTFNVNINGSMELEA